MRNSPSFKPSPTIRTNGLTLVKSPLSVASYLAALKLRNVTEPSVAVI